MQPHKGYLKTRALIVTLQPRLDIGYSNDSDKSLTATYIQSSHMPLACFPHNAPRVSPALLNDPS